MKEIIVLGKVEPKPKLKLIGKCPECGTEFTYKSVDVRKGGPYSIPHVFVECPICGKALEVPYDYYDSRKYDN